MVGGNCVLITCDTVVPEFYPVSLPFVLLEIAPFMRHPTYLLTLLLACLVTASCALPESLESDLPELMPIFRSSFEGDVQVVDHTEQAAFFTGADPTVESPNDFDQLNPPYLTKFNIQYLGGDLSQRAASIERDPEDASNRVLRFRLTDPGDKIKGRVQAQTTTETGFRELRYTYRMRLGDGWRTLANLPRRSGWFIMSEFWNGPPWTGHPYPFRAHLTLTNHRSVAEPGIYAGLLSETIPRDGEKERIWALKNHEIKLPIGEWFLVEVYIKEGGAETGRFVFRIRTADGGRHTVFDRTGFTHHPENPTPDGIRFFHPMKMYMGRSVVEAAVEGEGALEIYYDDFELFGLPVEFGEEKAEQWFGHQFTIKILNDS